jgi:hypothetical protein
MPRSGRPWLTVATADDDGDGNGDENGNGDDDADNRQTVAHCIT